MNLAVFLMSKPWWKKIEDFLSEGEQDVLNIQFKLRLKTQSETSQILKKLRILGFVKSRRVGKTVYNKWVPGALSQIKTDLISDLQNDTPFEVAKNWDRKIGPKDIVS